MCPSFRPPMFFFPLSQSSTYVRALQLEPDGCQVEQGETAGVCGGGEQNPLNYCSTENTVPESTLLAACYAGTEPPRGHHTGRRTRTSVLLTIHIHTQACYSSGGVFDNIKKIMCSFRMALQQLHTHTHAHTRHWSSREKTALDNDWRHTQL